MLLLMKNVVYALYLLLFITLSGCENPVVDDGNGDNGDKNNDNENVLYPDINDEEWLTVTEAQNIDIGTVICVEGYIVASCTRSIGNAVFFPPFEGSTAVIMAAEPVDPEGVAPDEDDLFPVCLTDYKDMREALNLEDNPELWNRHILIMGVKKSYMGLPGMKNVLDFQLLD